MLKVLLLHGLVLREDLAYIVKDTYERVLLFAVIMAVMVQRGDSGHIHWR